MSIHMQSVIRDQTKNANRKDAKNGYGMAATHTVKKRVPLQYINKH